MKSEKNAIKKLIDIESKVSTHYLIKRNGVIILMVPDLYIAWHAGKSKWKNYNLLNKHSIGIEISNKGHENGYQSFSKKQISSLIRLSKILIKKYKIKKNNILGHSDIAYNRKKDPGEKFPWKLLSKSKVGVWHNLNQKELIRARNVSINSVEKKKLFKYLGKFGYFINRISNSQKKRLLLAFQRRFRSELVSGKLDKECLLIAKKLSKLSL
tara:strand:- start:116 stop:751 length:636 start_codon:yes stop_codon:yes gene_type:complete